MRKPIRYAIYALLGSFAVWSILGFARIRGITQLLRGHWGQNAPVEVLIGEAEAGAEQDQAQLYRYVREVKEIQAAMERTVRQKRSLEETRDRKRRVLSHIEKTLAQNRPVYDIHGVKYERPEIEADAGAYLMDCKQLDATIAQKEAEINQTRQMLSRARNNVQKAQRAIDERRGRLMELKRKARWAKAQERLNKILARLDRSPIAEPTEQDRRLDRIEERVEAVLTIDQRPKKVDWEAVTEPHSDLQAEVRQYLKAVSQQAATNASKSVTSQPEQDG